MASDKEAEGGSSSMQRRQPQAVSTKVVEAFHSEGELHLMAKRPILLLIFYFQLICLGKIENKFYFLQSLLINE
ncbi:hypothetical protein PRUPE_1G202400 [Prunus persica]|uniref:Uncharacterized protein n=1 Tax=Prunus persica TaxID=3760 RepID=M5XGJ7_PRUPE|nr:hypothetical protein PRUPE_1G202400 [Prunus persica]